MTAGEIYQLIVLSMLLIVLGNLLLGLLVFRPPRDRLDDGAKIFSGDLPLVSVLIPARNEEHRLRPLLESLAKQTWPNLEILVLDDNSTDGTAELIRSFDFVEMDGALSGDAEKLRRYLLRGRPLPEGWAGKPWACHQLSEAARGEWLMFTDADTIHAPNSVESAVLYAQKNHGALLSAWPRQITQSWSERLIVPYVYFLILGMLPQWITALINRLPGLAKLMPPPLLHSLGAANGQFVLFRREAYLAIGGHASVKNHLVEDIALAREILKRSPHGLHLLNCDGSELVACRMYDSFSDLWEGFSKNLRPAFEKSPVAFVLFGLFQLVTMILPFISLILIVSGLFGSNQEGGAAELAWRLVIAQILVIYLIRVIPAILFRTAWLGVILQPFAHTLALIIALNSWRLATTGAIRWKGRNYQMGK